MKDEIEKKIQSYKRTQNKKYKLKEIRIKIEIEIQNKFYFWLNSKIKKKINLTKGLKK